MNHAYFRPGGVAIDLPETGIAQLRDLINWLEKHLPEYAAFCNENPIFKGRMVGIGHQDLTGCFALGVTGPILRSAGYAWDLRKQQPYCGYETYDFDVITWDTADAYGRFRVRLDEMWESLKIVKQATDRLEASTGQPVMIDDPKIAVAVDAGARPRRPGQQPRAHQAHHGRVDGGADPPLQAGDRGLPRPAGPGLRADREPQGRTGLPRRLRRRHQAVPGAHARPRVQPPPVRADPVRGRHAG